jgi:hypothetical protein
MPILIDRERIIRKWKPIFDALNVTDENIKGFMAEYAEKHSRMENWNRVYGEKEIIPEKKERLITHPDIDPYGEENWDDTPINNGRSPSGFHLGPDPAADVAQNLLPISMKILSKLNLEGKNLVVEDNPRSVEEYQVACSVSRNQIEDVRAMLGIDVVQKIENMLVEEMIQMINRRLEDKNNFHVYIMAESISLISEATWAPRMILKSRFKVE